MTSTRDPSEHRIVRIKQVLRESRTPVPFLRESGVGHGW
jgi:hypothetical protein